MIKTTNLTKKYGDMYAIRAIDLAAPPAGQIDRVEHNREAVRRRYSLAALQSSFTKVLDRLARSARS